jgi:hypothetical protein
MKAEDGPALYGGAVALVPDVKALCALKPSQLETGFNVLLFSDFLFDRSNVDEVEGRKVTAPPLLDLATGYGYRTIRGEDVRGAVDFPSLLLRQALDLVFSTWYAVPVLAFYPLLIVVFGLGDLPPIVIGFSCGVRRSRANLPVWACIARPWKDVDHFWKKTA